jgi:hypothetical protein
VHEKKTKSGNVERSIFTAKCMATPFVHEKGIGMARSKKKSSENV